MGSCPLAVSGVCPPCRTCAGWSCESSVGINRWRQGVCVRPAMCLDTWGHVSAYMSTRMSTHMSTHTHVYTHVYTHRTASVDRPQRCRHLPHGGALLTSAVIAAPIPAWPASITYCNSAAVGHRHVWPGSFWHYFRPTAAPFQAQHSTVSGPPRSFTTVVLRSAYGDDAVGQEQC